MESSVRSLAKAVTWQVLGLLTMTLIGFLFTGSVGDAGAIAATSSATALAAYVIHERLWQRVRWGIQPHVGDRHGA